MIYRQLQELNPYVRICVRTVTGPGWRLCDRIIYDHQFVLISQGRGSVLMGGRSFPARKGDLFLIRPGLVHGFIAEDTDPFEMLVIHFDFFYERDRNFWPHKKYHLSEGESEDNLPEKELLREVPVFDRTMQFPDYLHLQNYLAAEVLMKKLIDYNNAFMPGRELLVKSCFLEFLYIVYTESLDSAGSGQISGFERIRKAYEYINGHYMEELKLQKLAEQCSLSANYFSSLFKKHTSYSPKEYIMKIRIEKAKTLLVQGRQSVTEVAGLVGFHDIHYFSLYFKKFEGISPTGYREAFRGKSPACTETGGREEDR